MFFYNADIIAAIATPKGNGAIAVVRMSGNNCFELLNKITINSKKFGKDRFAYHTQIVDLAGNHIDDILLIKFKGPKSYTGEDMVELQCHGGAIIPEKVLSSVLLSGARHADPGEFTRRAFLNGKMDLIQAESVDSLIKTSSKFVYEKYLDLLESGGLKSSLFNIRQALVSVESEISASIDFDEEDNEYNTKESLKKEIISLTERVKSELETVSTIAKLDNGLKVALVGSPNSGKSTLFNLLLDDDRAIVHDTAGTTRDVIESELEIDGVKIKIFDTAGIRETDDEVENIGIKKTHIAIEKSDFVIWVQDCRHKQDATELKIDKPIIVLYNKRDLVPNDTVGERYISAIDKNYRQQVVDMIKKEIVEGLKTSIPDHIGCFNTRHEVLLKSIFYESKQLMDEIDFVSIDIISLHIREILSKMDALFGKVHDEDILNNIFSKFCMGK